MSRADSRIQESFAGHFLEKVLDTEKFKAFYMREEPRSRMMSTLFIFHPEGITIAGDLCPSLHGNCSALGYGLEWFAGELGESYLCSKFFTQGWHADLAEQGLLQMAKDTRAGKNDHEPWGGLCDLREDRETLIEDLLEERGCMISETDPVQKAEIRGRYLQARKLAPYVRLKLVAMREEIASRLERLAFDVDQRRLYDEWLEYFESDTEGVPGYGYPPGEAALLCALQQKFSELYHASVVAQTEG